MFLTVDPANFLQSFVPSASLDVRQPNNPLHDVQQPPTTEADMRKEYSTRLKIAFPDTEFTFLPFAPNDVEDNSARTLPRFRVDLPLMCESANQDPFDDNLPTGAPRDRQRRAAFDQVFAQVEHILHHQYRTFLFMVIFVGLSARLVRFDRSSVFVTRRFDITGSDVLIDFLARYTHLFPEDRGHDTTARYIDPTARDSSFLADKMRRYLQDAKTRKEEDYVIEMWGASLDERWPWWKLRVSDELTKKDRWFVVGKPSFQAHGILSRGTRCYVAVELLTDADENETLAKHFVYLKDCWRVAVDTTDDDSEGIQKEGKTLRRLNEAKVAHVPTLVAHGDIQGLATQAPDVLKVHEKHRRRMKSYHHYRLVVEEVGKPLSQFKNSGQLLLVMHDCLKAHSEAFQIGIIHGDISGGNILLHKDKKGDWRGLLTDWELSWDFHKDSKAHQLGRKGTPQFSAVRILDNPSKMVCVTDEIECFFHVLVYYAVRFLQHNLPDRLVDQFLNNYFEFSSGLTLTGELTAPELKRRVMETGRIPIDSCGPSKSLQFMWVNIPPKSSNQPDFPASLAPPNYNHPLNDLVSTLLSWFSALYKLERLKKAVPPDPAQGCLGGEVAFVFDYDVQHASPVSPPKPPSFADLAKLQDLADNVNHRTVLMLFRQACGKAYPNDKGDDKRP
ncbi:hypothetical protein GSI_04064 [Ganoderma sinense ZZ0214-1]|uniref:Fungal-type protein kinase domain-containing protein n=1 Tax=Ganoderma sinense ZZ0214-1 TaxID=1077348 RepID=A0A2G8SI53_9APHY|nr:hypothetical protein GSI_04064 [Ganoderma sinense ZZ0214-1]